MKRQPDSKVSKIYFLVIFTLATVQVNCGDDSNIKPMVASVPTSGLVSNQALAPQPPSVSPQPVQPLQPAVAASEALPAVQVQPSVPLLQSTSPAVLVPVQTGGESPRVLLPSNPVPPAPSVNLPATYPPGIARVQILKQFPCKNGCKDVSIRLELENPATIARWFVLPFSQQTQQKQPDPQGGVRLVRTYRFVDDEDQVVMGQFVGSNPFQAILLPPVSKVILNDFRVWFPKAQPASFEILITSNITMNPLPGEADSTMDFWMVGGANSHMSNREMQINLAPVGGNDFEGLAGAIQTQDRKERVVVFAEPVLHLPFVLEGLH